MSLDMATTVGGEYVNWLDELSKFGSFPIVAKIVEYHGPEQMTNGVVYPVTVDILFCGGSRKGEVELGEKLIGNGQTGTLRGVRNPKKDAPLLLQPPVYPVGHELGITVVKAKNGAVEYPAFNAPLPEHVPAIHEVYAGGQGWANAAAIAARKAAAQANTRTSEAIYAGASAPPVYDAQVAPAAPAYQPTVIPPSAPAPALAASAAPALPPGMTQEQWEAFQQFQAIQTAQAGLGATPVGGPPAPRSWS